MYSSNKKSSSSEEKTSTKKPEEKQPEPKAEGEKKTQYMFIHFEAIPRNMKEFENMEKFWLGFSQALNRIGLKFEEVKKRLQEGKPPFEDEEAVKKACDEALERLQEEKRLRDAANKVLKESEVGTVAKAAPKQPWKQQKYPQTALERLRQKALEEKQEKQRKRKEKETSSSSKGNSSSSRVIEVVETVSAKDYER